MERARSDPYRRESRHHRVARSPCLDVARVAGEGAGAGIALRDAVGRRGADEAARSAAGGALGLAGAATDAEAFVAGDAAGAGRTYSDSASRYRAGMIATAAVRFVRLRIDARLTALHAACRAGVAASRRGADLAARALHVAGAAVLGIGRELGLARGRIAAAVGVAHLAGPSFAGAGRAAGCHTVDDRAGLAGGRIAAAEGRIVLIHAAASARFLGGAARAGTTRAG